MSQDDVKMLSHSDRAKQTAQLIATDGFGSFFPNEQISEWSGYEPNTQPFSFFLTNVRNVLVEQGMWLSGEGQEGKGFFVVRPSENAVVASRFTGKAQRALKAMETLLERTPLDTLSEAEKRRHEKELRELKYTNRFFERKSEAVRLLNKHAPGLLKDDIDI
jgi:hypothetical protein